jgi:hypothetical protein
MTLDLMKSGALALLGVTAHGSPGELLQFDRLEAALATRFYRKTSDRRLGDTMLGYELPGTTLVVCFIIFVAKKI